MANRRLVPELMDDPALPERQHRRALRGLARINALSRAAEPIERAISDRFQPGDAPTLLDIAAGSGDVTRSVAIRLARRGLRPTIIGLDISTRAVETCRARFASPGIAASFHAADALHDPLPPADVVFCSLFLHHLADSDVTRLLTRMRGAASRMVVVSDLDRSRPGLAAAAIVPHLCTRSHVVQTDAVRSCRAALTHGELHRHADRAGLEGARITRIFPFRLLLVWAAGQ